MCLNLETSAVYTTARANKSRASVTGWTIERGRTFVGHQDSRAAETKGSIGKTLGDADDGDDNDDETMKTAEREIALRRSGTEA